MASLAPPEPAKNPRRAGMRRSKSGGRGRATEMSLDEMDDLEKAWWGDGFPVYISEEDKRAIEGGRLQRKCWLDEVD